MFVCLFTNKQTNERNVTFTSDQTYSVTIYIYIYMPWSCRLSSDTAVIMTSGTGKTRFLQGNKFEPWGLYCTHSLFIKFHWRTWMKPNTQLNWFNPRIWSNYFALEVVGEVNWSGINVNYSKSEKHTLGTKGHPIGKN